jgi:hypothetical protein
VHAGYVLKITRSISHTLNILINNYSCYLPPEKFSYVGLQTLCFAPLCILSFVITYQKVFVAPMQSSRWWSAVVDPGIKTYGASQQKLWDQTIYATVKLH